jgi:CRISPR/Cas system type I-B associated protein Csh2 (Cas7 group RAMP superfamily)
MVEKEINQSITKFFDDLRTKGMRAIAYCDKEEGRVMMLEVMEFSSIQEVRLKNMINAFLQDVAEETIITTGDGIPEDLLEQAGPISKVLDISTSQETIMRNEPK